jgi:hypothetical protein
MRLIHRSRRSPSFFNSPKCISAIPPATPLHRDLLVQSALDPHVRSIEFVDEIRHRGRTASPRSIVLHRDDGRFLIDLTDRKRGRNPVVTQVLLSELSTRGISVLEIDFEEIRLEPRFGNARRIWEYRFVDPTVRERERILDRLSERGPQTVYELELWAPSHEILPVVCALACADIVEIDLDRSPLGPRTLIRTRR